MGKGQGTMANKLYLTGPACFLKGHQGISQFLQSRGFLLCCLLRQPPSVPSF